VPRPSCVGAMKVSRVARIPMELYQRPRQ